jgi:hypothetical protein
MIQLSAQLTGVAVGIEYEGVGPPGKPENAASARRAAFMESSSGEQHSRMRANSG